MIVVTAGVVAWWGLGGCGGLVQQLCKFFDGRCLLQLQTALREEACAVVAVFVVLVCCWVRADSFTLGQVVWRMVVGADCNAQLMQSLHVQAQYVGNRLWWLVVKARVMHRACEQQL